MKVERKCRCGTKFMAREADVKRGWAKSCSKSCAAKKSNKETGKYMKLLYGGKRKRTEEYPTGTFDMDGNDGSLEPIYPWEN